MAYLEVTTSQGVKRLELTSGPISVGRQPNNSLVLDDDKASRQHCVIEPYEGGFRVRDLGSRNGTKLNDQKIVSELLENGDVVRIGSTEMRFIDPEQVAPRRQRRNTPDFAAVHAEKRAFQQAQTVDLDLHGAVVTAETNYEK